MARETLTIVIRGQDRISGPLRSAGRGFQELGDDASDAARDIDRGMDDASESIESLGDSATSAATVMIGQLGARAVEGILAGIGKIGSAIGEMVLEAANVSAIERSFISLVSTIGVTAPAAMEEFREATRGLVSDADLMTLSNKILASGLGETTEEVADILELASQLSVAFGEDIPSNIENFLLLMLNQSILRLDSFGISGAKAKIRMDELMEGVAGTGISAAALSARLADTQDNITELTLDVQEAALAQGEWTDRTRESTKFRFDRRLAKTNQELAGQNEEFARLSKITPGVTKGIKGLSKEEAFSQTVFELGREVLERVGEQGEGTTASMARLQTKIANLRIAIGSAFLPIFGRLINIVSGFVDRVGPKLIEWAESAARFIGTTLPQAFATFRARASTALFGFAAGLAKTRPALSDMITAVGSLVKGTTDVETFAAAFGPLFKAVVDELIKTLPEGVQTALDTANRIITEDIPKFVQGIKDAFAAGGIAGIADFLAPEFSKAIRTAFEFGGVRGVGEFLIQEIKEFGTRISDAFTEFWLGPMMMLGPGAPGRTAGDTRQGGGFRDQVIAFGEGLIETISGFGSRLVEAVTTWWLGPLVDPVDPGGDEFRAGGGFRDAIADFVGNIGDEIKRGAPRVIEAVQEFLFGPIADPLTTGGIPVRAGGGLVDRLVKFGQELGAKIAEGLKSFDFQGALEDLGVSEDIISGLSGLGKSIERVAIAIFMVGEAFVTGFKESTLAERIAVPPDVANSLDGAAGALDIMATALETIAPLVKELGETGFSNLNREMEISAFLAGQISTAADKISGFIAGIGNASENAEGKLKILIDGLLAVPVDAIKSVFTLVTSPLVFLHDQIVAIIDAWNLLKTTLGGLQTPSAGALLGGGGNLPFTGPSEGAGAEVGPFPFADPNAGTMRGTSATSNSIRININAPGGDPRAVANAARSGVLSGLRALGAA